MKKEAVQNHRYKQRKLWSMEEIERANNLELIPCFILQNKEKFQALNI